MWMEVSYIVWNIITLIFHNTITSISSSSSLYSKSSSSSFPSSLSTCSSASGTVRPGVGGHVKGRIFLSALDRCPFRQVMIVGLWPVNCYFGTRYPVRFRQVSALDHVCFRQVLLYNKSRMNKFVGKLKQIAHNIFESDEK